MRYVANLRDRLLKGITDRVEDFLVNGPLEVSVYQITSS